MAIGRRGFVTGLAVPALSLGGQRYAQEQTAKAPPAGAGPAGAVTPARSGTGTGTDTPTGSRIPVSQDDTVDQLVAKAARLRPTEPQIAWQRLERTAFLHFGVNTFTGLEWGTGDEDPRLFRPTGLDTDQWARALRDGGFSLAVLTVKHHDGFVLYPSRHTAHSVASSDWENGRGDVLRSFADSMRRHGIKVGVYVSPADENQYLHGVYANGSARTPRTIPTAPAAATVPTVTTAPAAATAPVAAEGPAGSRRGPVLRLPATDYGAYMLNQLYEILTEYGPVDEVWFDGAQGRIPPDKVESYDWDSWYALIRALAPDAVIAVSGPDVRWVGNEDGSARENEWSTVPVRETAATHGRTDFALSYDTPDQGSRAALAAARPRTDCLRWWPAECDVSIRPGWFFHAEERPKTAEQLTDLYFRSVGRNAVLLLNVPPDRRGLLHEADVAVLSAFDARLRRELPEDLALGCPARGDGRWPGRAVDGDPDTSWTAPEPVTGARGTLTLDLGTPRTVDRVRLAEDIRHGQQVEQAVVEAETDGGWTRVAETGTIGASRILLLPAPVTARHWRLRVLATRERTRIARFELHRSRP
ncbi:alpha-L-fucosidase [Streptomyces sp. NRRL F-5135]|uniref:alpha-L-fucosidase n=1 Tax=Streptomyces sp. NRRL F-5135 TaxID=1463858 RepID=UPI0004C76399|nr:alpha-L-fucosidase [Streptomyces sp. NRRL F-5135]